MCPARRFDRVTLHGTAARDLSRASTRRPRVAIVTDAIYPYHMGGKESRTHNLVAGIAGNGYDVHVFTMNWWHGDRTRVDAGVTYHALCREHPLYNDSRRSMVEAVVFALACFRLLWYRFDLIEADQIPHLPVLSIWLVAKVRRTPLVITCHEFWGPEYWRSYLGPLGSLAAILEKLTVRLPDHIVTPMRGTAAKIIEKGARPDRVTIVPNGVDAEAIARAARPAQSFDILFVGRLLAHKNVDLLIEAIALLRDRGTPTTCGIVGTGPERERLEELSEKYDLVDAITFFGKVGDHSSVFGLMKAASVFVLPSVREGYGMVVAEALCSGLPVITVDHPENEARELVEDGVTGRICEPTAEALAAALASVLGSTERPALPERARRRFSWSESVRSLEAVYRSQFDSPAIAR